jgi:serine O-acetyltransferase
MNLNLHGIDVLPGARIGGGLRIEHPVGIVIGAGCVLGENCTIMQGVTLGVRSVIRKFNTHKYPIVGSNVFIGPNSTLLGDIIIGDNVTINAHSLVLISCPEKSKYSRNGLSSLNNMGDSLGDSK